MNPQFSKKPRKGKNGTTTQSSVCETVTLIKGIHQWSFGCEPGSEGELLRRLSELASQGDVPFDWFDAALVSHQLNKRLKPGLHRIDGSSTDSR